jgi:hypothetical protein
MTDSSAPPRPRQVTFAAGLIMVGSVFVVLTVFERVAGLQSLETQQSVEKFLSEPPGDGLGIGVQGVLDILRVLAMVAGGCAAAMGVLGYSVLQRSRGARIALTVLAGPLFVSGMVTGGFMSSVVVASAVMLWFQPARDWFDGVTREPERPSPAAPAAPPSRDRADEVVPGRPGAGGSHGGSGGRGGRGGSGGSTSTDAGQRDAARHGEPPAYSGFGTAPAPGQTSAPAWPPAPPLAGSGSAATTRPNAVRTACVLTWVTSGLAVVMMAISVVVLASSPGLVYDELVKQNPELANQGVSERVLVDATYVLAAVVVVWSLVAIALAALVFRRVGWARPVLMASAGVAALLCLLAVLVGQFLVLVPLAACVTTVALLARPESTAWFRP